MIKYIEKESFLHRINPISKIVILFIFAYSLFLFNYWEIEVLALVSVLFLYVVSGIGLSKIEGKKFFITFSLSLFIINVLFIREGDAILNSGIIKITTNGIEFAIFSVARFLAIVFSSFLFVMTTEPNKLAYSLMQAGIPYRYGFTLVVALRFVPTFQFETGNVRNAQAARGLSVDKISIKSLYMMARYTFIPLIRSTMQYIDTLTVSMEGRCFGAYDTRTYIEEVGYGKKDVALLILSVIFLIGIIYQRFGQNLF
ncbi:MAG: Energy-coupling factor transporter transmembrane protein EcfT [Candidatus Methanofastidiosum methylothiophilum]|uniref:Energy-coupling factor transporter transmembrane protein EcfT n=1 Tax=Candidatus Methanofastidiosum methylothiophilum TaxID=1705564 RepID=A0A150IR29_9EURY|nr:MAG: Energy-coupling factor transporter transmembrane protein EcfT [Candidatus Methanofastidiosum methylthiophilus]KYC47295.1 MAG: Energy-coupling factor transporter transmembrane protein EcfT [Candidatus Methanofastidiosum methylthiophilus]KYC49748.1 MAG: Energy-coupling factor transporter transmembrane protein EcfT [Candidatus Methanofastidiosum methylthiophilus]